MNQSLRFVLLMLSLVCFACIQTQAQDTPSKEEEEAIKKHIQLLLHQKEELQQEMKEIDQQLIECMRKLLAVQAPSKEADQKLTDLEQLQGLRDRIRKVTLQKQLAELMLKMPLSSEEKAKSEVAWQQYEKELKELQAKNDAILKEHKVVMYTVVLKVDNPLFNALNPVKLECVSKGSVDLVAVDTLEFFPGASVDFNFTGKDKKGETISAAAQQWIVDVNIYTIDLGSGARIDTKAALKPSDDGKYHLNYEGIDEFMKKRK